MAIDVLQDYVQRFQDRRKLVTDDVLDSFMKPRKLQWGGNPNPNPTAKPTVEMVTRTL